LQFKQPGEAPAVQQARLPLLQLPAFNSAAASYTAAAALMQWLEWVT
jgi:hypothetical protein